MSHKPQWTMSATTDDSAEMIDFKIIDNHHANSFYGEWQARDNDELTYHINGLQECIERGTYKDSEYIMNGKPIKKWNDFERALTTYLNHHGKTRAA